MCFLLVISKSYFLVMYDAAFTFTMQDSIRLIDTL